VLIAQALIALSASILFVLGSLHLLFTYWGPKLRPRDPALQTRMAEVSPVISRQTTMWKTWLGFNGSHSLGLLLFGLVYGYLALLQPAFLFASKFLLAVGFCTLAAYAALAKTYWFRVPLTGAVLALTSYGAGLVAALVR